MDKDTHNTSQKKKKVTATQALAIEALLQGFNNTQVAQQVGMTRETISRWLSLPHFQEELELQKELLYQNVRDALTSLTMDAIEVVRQNMGFYKGARVGLSVLDKIGKILVEK